MQTGVGPMRSRHLASQGGSPRALRAVFGPASGVSAPPATTPPEGVSAVRVTRQRYTAGGLSERRLAGALAGGLVMAWLLPAGLELGVRLGDALPLAGRAALAALILGALALGWRAALREEVSRG